MHELVYSHQENHCNTTSESSQSFNVQETEGLQEKDPSGIRNADVAILSTTDIPITSVCMNQDGGLIA